MRKVGERLAVHEQVDELRANDVHRRSDWRDLKLDEDEPQLLDPTRAAGAAIAIPLAGRQSGQRACC